jgi:hypothetical protein
VIHLILKVVRKADEGDKFVFVQLIVQKPAIYDKRHPDYARQDKIDLSWGKNFSSDEGVWIQVKFFQNNISDSGQFKLSQKNGCQCFVFLILYLLH